MTAVGAPEAPVTSDMLDDEAPGEPGPLLSEPEEPTALRETLRDAVLGGADWSAQFGEELGVGDALWSAWGSMLTSSGMDRATFGAVVAGYRRELWFWLLGDRRWSQVAAGLAGRLERRLPTDSSS